MNTEKEGEKRGSSNKEANKNGAIAEQKTFNAVAEVRVVRCTIIVLIW
jgi:hypothetical protein